MPAAPELWQRIIKSQFNLNDAVEAIHLAILNDKDLNTRYNRLLWGVYPEQMVEGSEEADNLLVAMMIREKALSLDAGHPVGQEKLATIAKSKDVVLRRYGQSRRQRRATLAGQIVPEEPEANPDHE